MSIAYLAQPEQQQKLKRLDGGTLALLLDSQATDGKLTWAASTSSKERHRPTIGTSVRTRSSC